ncbi:hypothetical protein AgCh_027829 [Apium graveolens]
MILQKGVEYSIYNQFDYKHKSSPVNQPLFIPEVYPPLSSDALDEKKNKQQAYDATNQGAKYEGAQIDNIDRKKSSGSGGGRVKQLAGLSKRTSPLKTSTHAGIVKPFKAPAQTSEIQRMQGQKFKSLKNLEAARLHK